MYKGDKVNKSEIPKIGFNSAVITLLKIVPEMYEILEGDPSELHELRDLLKILYNLVLLLGDVNNIDDLKSNKTLDLIKPEAVIKALNIKKITSLGQLYKLLRLDTENIREIDDFLSRNILSGQMVATPAIIGNYVIDPSSTNYIDPSIRPFEVQYVIDETAKLLKDRRYRPNIDYSFEIFYTAQTEEVEEYYLYTLKSGDKIKILKKSVSSKDTTRIIIYPDNNPKNKIRIYDQSDYYRQLFKSIPLNISIKPKSNLEFKLP